MFAHLASMFPGRLQHGEIIRIEYVLNDLRQADSQRTGL
jgi:hypothetical protein